MQRYGLPALLLSALLALPAAARTGEIVSYAFVQDDATLEIRGKTIRLFGIHILRTERTCRTFIRPIQCGPRAALALEFKIGAKFVHRDPVQRHEDRSITAVCRVDDEDLSAYLLERGWAVALPHAPIEYQTLERIARRRNLGIVR